MFNIVTLEEVFAKIDLNKDLAFDIETIKLYGTIRLAQFYQNDWDVALLVDRPDPYQLFTFFATNPQLSIVTQYGTYEWSTIQTQTGARWYPEQWNDTFYLARLAYPKLSEFKLDYLIVNIIGHDPYKDAGLDKSALQKSDWSKTVLTREQLLYAALDVYYLLDLYDHVKIQASSTSYKLDMYTCKYMLDFQTVGMPVDASRCEKHYIDNMTKINKINLPINSNSYKQVRPYIGSNQSDALGLIKLALQGNTRAKDVHVTRKLLKQNSFLDKFNTMDGRIYGRFAPSARSGRATCSDQNLEQLPRLLKDCFGVKQGKAMLYADYSQLELRSIGAITGEPAFLKIYKAGGDIHNYVAEMTFGADFQKWQRQIAKTENFNLLYGGGAGMLQSILLMQAELFVEEEELKRLKRKWKRLFPVIAAWQERGIRAYHRGELGSTPFGRRYLANMMTDQLNIENQGFGAEVAKLAIHYMYNDMRKAGGEMCNFIHDSYIIECDDDPEVYIPLAKIVAEAKREAWSEATKLVKVKDMPMPVTVRVGYNWGDIEEGKFIHEHKIPH